MNKKIILFDVDGTITNSGEIIESDIKKIINDISKYFDIGIVGGGKLDKILLQLDGLYIKHYFTECGCVYYINNSNNTLLLENKYMLNIREHKLYEKINILIKEALYFLSQVNYLLTGNFIDLRNGMIYISLIGMSANKKEREIFIEQNDIFNYREQLLNILINKAIEIEINNDVTICEGGSVGLAIYPNENDKVQVIPHLIDKYNEIHYFGDKYCPNGNDYKIINHSNILGHPVNSTNDTKLILLQIYNNCKFD
jgi:phosphomannomutase